MAELNRFKCCECGYEVIANGKGYDRFMSGWQGYYSCKHCKEVVSLNIPAITWEERGMKALFKVLGEIQPCPECGQMDLRPWTSRSKCPKCGNMMTPENVFILAD